MIKKLTNKKIVLISATVIVVVLTLGFTLALWSRNFTQTGTNTITSDCFNIEYSESGATSLVNAYPQTDADGLKNVPYIITIENTCDTIATYDVVLNELSSNTLAESNIKVAINDNYKMLNVYESTTPSSEVTNASSARKLIIGLIPGHATRKISVKSWMDENTTEVEGENKTFDYKITMEVVAENNNLLVSKILTTNNINSTLPTTAAFQNGEPISIKEVNGATYREVQTDNDNTISMTTSKYVGDGYTFDNTTGRYTLTGYELYTDETDIIDKYTCNSTSYSDCNSVYKLKAYNGATVKILKQYSSVGSISGSGVFSAPDDDGTSFYLRGEIDNNYVSFANKLWRVVRINGDGTIRLILEDKSQISYLYNNDYEGHKYVGYTYDNSKLCTNTSPCTGNEGTSITIKNYLDGWYTSNLLSYDNKIAVSTYCNDTSYTESNDTYYYGSYSRINNGTPSLLCPDTNVTYGGVYKLKIGLISSDELNMAGYNGKGNDGSALNYLYKTYWFWTGSARTSSSSGSSPNSGAGGAIRPASMKTSANWIRPVINLVSDVKVASGNGTQSTPYVIDMN